MKTAGLIIIGFMLAFYAFGMIAAWVKGDKVASFFQAFWGLVLLAAVLMLITGCVGHPIGQTYYHTGVKRTAYKPPVLPVSFYNPFAKHGFIPDPILPPVERPANCE